MRCSKCGKIYDGWERGVFVGKHPFTREEFDEEYVDQAASETCPSCDTKVYYDDMKRCRMCEEFEIYHDGEDEGCSTATREGHEKYHTIPGRRNGSGRSLSFGAEYGSHGLTQSVSSTA